MCLSLGPPLADRQADMANLGRGKAGGLQDMIKSATAENRPGPDWMLNKAIVDYINRSPNRYLSSLSAPLPAAHMLHYPPPARGPTPTIRMPQGI